MTSVACNTLFVLSFITFLSTTFLSTNGSKYSFTIDLIPSDSPKSPLYNNKMTPFQRINDDIRRSISRARHFFPPKSNDQYSPSDHFIDVPLIPAYSGYIISYSIGNPPLETFGIVDTGSDQIWTQCKGCYHCYPQTAPKFDPLNSTTYKSIFCNSQQCAQPANIPKCNVHNICQYNARYADGTYSIGDLGTDTIELGTPGGVIFPEIEFGCGYRNNASFDQGTSGIIGLGGGENSLVSQIDFFIEGRFSYCMVPYGVDKVSKMSFGDHAIVSGPGTVSTPLVDGMNTTFYHLTLEAISVGDKRFEFSSGGGGVTKGNIIIDSGTTLTILPPDFYSSLESEVISQMKNLNDLERVFPKTSMNLCYKYPSNNQSFQVPLLTIHFKGADLKLNSYNAYVAVSSDAFCFAFLAYPHGYIYGNIAQINFIVSYDRGMNIVSFKPVDCSTI